MGENGGQQKDLVCNQFQEAGDSVKKCAVEACDVEVGAGRSVGENGGQQKDLDMYSVPGSRS